MTYTENLSRPRSEQSSETGRDVPSSRPAVLDLMLPNDLPADLAPGPQEAGQIAQTLSSFLAALDQPDRAARCRELLASLGDGSGTTAQIVATAIPAKTDEVEEFDNYFNVRRVTADTPALSLLRGLLQTSSAVLSLAERGTLSPSLVERQVHGFATYGRILGRVCNVTVRSGSDMEIAQS